ncbi:hypothetical protein Tco_0076612 [Tanacetum coccineum]
MSRLHIAGGKNWLMKACLISSQVVITSGLCSLNQILASPARDDGKSFNLMASAFVFPYQNIPHILTNLAMCLCGLARERSLNCRSLIMERWCPLTVKLSPRSTMTIAASGVAQSSAGRQGDHREAVPGRQRTAPGGSKGSVKYFLNVAPRDNGITRSKS